MKNEMTLAQIKVTARELNRGLGRVVVLTNIGNRPLSSIKTWEVFPGQRLRVQCCKIMGRMTQLEWEETFFIA